MSRGRFPWALVTVCGVVVLVATGLYVRHVFVRFRETFDEADALLRQWRENERTWLLHEVDGAQLRFKTAVFADADGDGEGEYADLDALAHAVLVRDPPLDLDAWIDGEPIGLGGGLWSFEDTLRQVRDGRMDGEDHIVEVFLPRDATGAVLTDLAEEHWCAYAWPAQRDAGGRTFFINEQREILACEGYFGDDAPAPDAAYLPGAPGIAGPAAAGAVGRDGRRWLTVPGK